MAVSSRKRPLNENEEKALTRSLSKKGGGDPERSEEVTTLTEKELEEVIRKVASQKVFIDTFKAAFNYAAKDAYAQAVTFEEAFEIAYKEAIKETFEIFFL